MLTIREVEDKSVSLCKSCVEVFVCVLARVNVSKEKKFRSLVA